MRGTGQGLPGALGGSWSRLPRGVLHGGVREGRGPPCGCEEAVGLPRRGLPPEEEAAVSRRAVQGSPQSGGAGGAWEGAGAGPEVSR